MYIERVPNRGSRPAILLREGWREGGRVRKRTLANLTDWPEAKILALAAVLKGEEAIGDLRLAFEVVRSRPHGHVAAVLGALRSSKLEQALAAAPSRERDLCVADKATFLGRYGSIAAPEAMTVTEAAIGGFGRFGDASAAVGGARCCGGRPGSAPEPGCPPPGVVLPGSPNRSGWRALRDRRPDGRGVAPQAWRERVR